MNAYKKKEKCVSFIITFLKWYKHSWNSIIIVGVTKDSNLNHDYWKIPRLFSMIRQPLKSRDDRISHIVYTIYTGFIVSEEILLVKTFPCEHRDLNTKREWNIVQSFFLVLSPHKFEGFTTVFIRFDHYSDCQQSQLYGRTNYFSNKHVTLVKL